MNKPETTPPAYFHHLRDGTEMLCERFGQQHFVYAGNDATDFAVWDCAASAIVVNPPTSIGRQVKSRYQVDAALQDERPGYCRSAIRAMRPYQWVKNALCLVPIAAAADFTNVSAWANALAIVAAFCLVASGIYLINDISDLGADRAHPRKSRRPFASGNLPIAIGVILCPMLMLAGAVLGWLSGSLLALLIYVVSSLAYNIWLKEKPLIDVFVLAELYTIRLFGGGEASGHPVSLWLLGFSSFLFLSLAFVKRVAELQRLAMEGGRQPMRRGYLVRDAALLQTFGCASAFTSAIVLSLYVQSNTASTAYSNPTVLWMAIPLLLFWQCRLWLSTARGTMHDDPIIFAARDRVSWAVLACLAIVVAAAWCPLVSFR